jgi:hypothetical protein
MKAVSQSMSKLRASLLLFTLFVASAGAMAENGDSDSFRYASLFPRSTIELDRKNDQIVLDGHSVSGASACPSSSKFHCFGVPSSLFVFPRSGISEQSAWEYDGHKFNVQRKVKGQVLGRRYSAFLVKSQRNDDGYWYLYSPVDGLLAFGLKNATTSSAFILEGRCGFGAKKGCS